MDHFLHQLVTKLSDVLVSHEVQHLSSLTLSHLNSEESKLEAHMSVFLT
jgi:hypothetical protein